MLAFLGNRKSYFENLNVKLVKENKNFWGKVAPLFSNKIKCTEIITLNENKDIISNAKKVAETFHGLFSNVVKTLNIFKNHFLFLEHFKLIQPSNPSRNFSREIF